MSVGLGWEMSQIVDKHPNQRNAALFGKVYRTTFQSKKRRLVFKSSVLNCSSKIKNYTLRITRKYLQYCIFTYIYIFYNILHNMNIP